MAHEVDATRIPELQQVVSSALALAQAAGASAADADASVQKGLTVTVRLGEVDTIEYHAAWRSPCISATARARPVPPICALAPWS
jgi:hypothetical protein